MGAGSFFDETFSGGKQRRDRNADEQRTRDAEAKLAADEASFRASEDKKAFDKKEADRMGSQRTKTLLTGGKGLDDDDLSISRKKLMGF